MVGGCNTEWYNEEGVKVNCEEDEKPCAEAHCLRDPCVGAECPTHPDATCKPNYCSTLILALTLTTPILLFLCPPLPSLCFPCLKMHLNNPALSRTEP